MRFQGRDHGERSSAGTAQRPRRVVRLVPDHPLGRAARLETLESRVLLSGVAQAEAISLPVLTFPFAPGLMVPLATRSVAISGTASSGDASFQISPMESATDLGLAETGGGGPVVTVTKTIHSSGESTTGMMVVSNPSSGDLGEDSISPVIVLAPESDGPPPSQQGFFPVDYGTSAGIEGPVRQSTASPPTVPVSPPASGEESASIPYDKHVIVNGAIAATHGFMSVQIPVGPMTREVGVSVRPDFQGDPGSPELADLLLLDKDGDIIAQVSPVWNPQTNSSTDAMTVTLMGAPVDGTLVVQITTPAEAAGRRPPPHRISPLAAGLTVPFVMNVQRVDATGSGNYGELGSLVGGQAGLGRSGIGTLSASSSGPDFDSGATTTTTETGLAGPKPRPCPVRWNWSPPETSSIPTGRVPRISADGSPRARSPLGVRRPWARTW